jgi:hypothetical protein
MPTAWRLYRNGVIHIKTVTIMKESFVLKLEFVLRYGYIRVYDVPLEFELANENRDYASIRAAWDWGKIIYHFSPYFEYMAEVIQIMPEGKIEEFVESVHNEIKES